MDKLRIFPITQAEAQTYIEQHHRHLGRVTGSIFQIACAEGNRICGVAICGRPVARLLDKGGFTIEVNRCATDGTKNACSMLYGACWRTARSQGYKRIITYNLESESGVSLRAAGYKAVAETPGTPWSNNVRKRKDPNPNQRKFRWEITTADWDPNEVRPRVRLNSEQDELI